MKKKSKHGPEVISESAQSWAVAISVFIFMLIYIALTYPDTPRGLFTDEVKIGYTAWEFVNLNFTSFTPPFFYAHYEYLLGALTPVLISPVVWLFGLSEWSTRFGSSFYAVLGLFCAYLSLRVLRLRSALVAVVLVFVTPIFFHLSRVQFGHTSAFFAFQLGLLIFVYLRSRESKKWYAYGVAGMVMSLGVYAYGSYTLQIPIFVTVLGVVDFLCAKDKRKAFIRNLLLGLGLVVALGGIVYALGTNDLYKKRFAEKSADNPAPLIQKLIKNYPKYFDFEYLAVSGENGWEGVYLTRHSVTGAGIVYGSQIFLFLFAFILLHRQKYNLTEQIAATAFVWILLTPISDVITTKPNSPPYTFTMYAMVFGLPIIIAFTLDYFLKSLEAHRMSLRKAIGILMLCAIFASFSFETTRFFGAYKNYPAVSEDYWGWQWGAKDILAYFETQQDKYDELYLEAYFNNPVHYVQFYTVDKPCLKCKVGNIRDFADRTKKQMFAVRIESYEKDNLAADYRIVRDFKYLNGQTAFYVLVSK